MTSRDVPGREQDKDISRQSLRGKVAVVTGATSGIGRAIAIAFAREGAQVCPVGRQADQLEAMVGEVQGTKIAPHQADLTDPDAIRRLVKHIDREFGQTDMLVHGMGMLALGATREASLENFDRHLAVNLRAPYELTRALLSMLIAQQGEIVFLNSSVVRYPRADSGQYGATKHGLLGLADSLRQEVNPQGVRVLSIFPGRTATPMQQRIHEREKRPYQPERLLQPEDVASTVIHAVKLPRSAEITDIYIRPMLGS
jgi:NAD(P)-dependent dehydrogenase (short-subunit alcohol dehydrogenase family)